MKTKKMFVRLYSTYPPEIRDVAMHGSSPRQISNLRGEADASQKSEDRGLDRYLAALPAMKYRCGSHLIPLANSTNAVALNAAPNAATRSGNFFLVQRTRFPASLEMILRGIGMKTHF